MNRELTCDEEKNLGHLKVLDCTLRDGGYVNDFCFGEKTICGIIEGLSRASIDIIECGFMRDEDFDKDRTIFSSTDLIGKYLMRKNSNCMYVAMIQCGAISDDKIARCDGKSIDGIRVTFHEHEVKEALLLGKRLIDKGYKVFMQPVGTTSYTEEALIDLIDEINELKPYSFYMVDTLGKMYVQDILHLYELIDSHLDSSITLGFHSHNNLQMSFANAQALALLNTQRELIIDSSIMGMGRGAGNLNTELFTQFLNVNLGYKYDAVEIMALMDEYIQPLSRLHKWGYDSAYYIAAVKDCHPNYASFLLNKHTLCIRDIDIILTNLNQQKRTLFDHDYVNDEYIKYMSHLVDDKSALAEIETMIGQKDVLLIAPGKSIDDYRIEITDYICQNNPYVMSVNFVPTDIDVDAVFVSNMKRFKSIEDIMDRVTSNVIITSNIDYSETRKRVYKINYSSYLNEEERIIDNAGLMCLNLLKRIGIRKITLAGFDGFSENMKGNFVKQDLYVNVEGSSLQELNAAMTKRIKQLRQYMEISFFAQSYYE